MNDLAIKALRLYEAYESLPTDRGGKNGPKGKAWQAFLDAKKEALNPEPITTTPTPYGDVVGPASAIKYLTELAAARVRLGLKQATNPRKGVVKSALLDKIITHIIVQLDVHPDKTVNEETEFVDDLLADELDMCELAMWVEDTFVITVSDEEMDACVSIGDLEKLIIRKTI